MTLVPVALIGGFPMASAVAIDTTEVPYELSLPKTYGQVWATVIRTDPPAARLPDIRGTESPFRSAIARRVPPEMTRRPGCVSIDSG
jgi:hypothetical protein